jgi:hypothetical protein
MTLDALDQAFIDRWERRVAAAAVPWESHGELAPPVASLAAAGQPPRLEPELVNPPAARAGRTAAAPHDETASLAVDAKLVSRLLVAGRDQWACLADEVEAARLAGHRVIAVAGGERGEGRTTLVACLSRALRDRGREIIVLGSVAALATTDGGPADGGWLHDKRIVLVDAGIWFPPGPIRRQRLLVASLGCDAAILVRRADREPAPARATALAAGGVTALGEVVTFAPPAPTTIPDSEDA